jgi:hypothetical protein
VYPVNRDDPFNVLYLRSVASYRYSKSAGGAWSADSSRTSRKVRAQAVRVMQYWRTTQGVCNMAVPEQDMHELEDECRQRDARTNEHISVTSRKRPLSSDREHHNRRRTSNVQQNHRQERGLQSRLHYRDISVYSTHGGTVQEDTRQDPHRPEVDLQRVSCSIEKSSGEHE